MFNYYFSIVSLNYTYIDIYICHPPTVAAGEVGDVVEVVVAVADV